MFIKNLSEALRTKVRYHFFSVEKNISAPLRTELFSLSSKNRDIDLMGTLVVTVSTLLGSAFSYGLQFYLGYKLSIENFGIINSLLSFATIFGVVSVVLNAALVKVVTYLYSKNELEKLSYLYFEIVTKVLSLTLFGLVIFYLLDVVGVTLFKTFPKWSFFSMGIFSLSYLYISVNQGYLQGMLKYYSFSFQTLLASMLRVVFGMLMVFWAYEIPIMFLGMTLGIILSYVISLPLVGVTRPSRNTIIDLKAEYAHIWTYIKPLFLLNLLLVGLNNVDLILVQYFLDSTAAGVYSGVITLGKILLFGSIPVTMVMYPKISTLVAQGSSIKKHFTKFFSLQLSIVGLGTLIYILYAANITYLFFGQKFEPTIEYLPIFSIFIFLYVLIYFLCFFYMAVDKKNVFVYLLVGFIFQCILIGVFHESLTQVIYSNIAASSLIVLAMLYGLKEFLVKGKIK